MKRSWEEASGGDGGDGGKGKGDGKRGPGKTTLMSGGVAMKLLISAQEASVILGPSGSTSRAIGQATETRLALSGRDEFYPGTGLQELQILGKSMNVVLESLVQVLAKMAEAGGKISNGDATCPDGEARVKFIVPTVVARALIGKGGENIKNLRRDSGLNVHVEESSLAAGDTTEQIVSLKGGLAGIEIALPIVLEKMELSANDGWFNSWATTSLAKLGGGGGYKGGGKDKGKGKGKDAGKDQGKWGKDKGWYEPEQQYYEAPAMHYQDKGGKSKGKGGDWSKGGGGGGKDKDYAAPRGFQRDNGGGGRQWQDAAAPAPEFSEELVQTLEVISEAIQVLPEDVAHAKTQKIAFTMPTDRVSAVIGKGGSGVKEIGRQSHTQINVRDLEGSPDEKSVIITGGAVGVMIAYLQLLGRINLA